MKLGFLKERDIQEVADNILRFYSDRIKELEGIGDQNALSRARENYLGLQKVLQPLVSLYVTGTGEDKNRVRAALYALRHHADYAPGFNHLENDCANLTSQALLAGGFQYDYVGGWHPGFPAKESASDTKDQQLARYVWGSAEGQQYRLRNIFGFSGTYVVKQPNQSIDPKNKAITLEELIKSGKVKIGDTLYFQYNVGDEATHSVIVVGFDENDIYFAGHTEDRAAASLREKICGRVIVHVAVRYSPIEFEGDMGIFRPKEQNLLEEGWEWFFGYSQEDEDYLHTLNQFNINREYDYAIHDFFIQENLSSFNNIEQDSTIKIELMVGNGVFDATT